MNNWVGTFNSSTYTVFLWPIVHGTIKVTLPDNIKDVKNTDATMIYEGIYRKGDQSIFPFNYNVPENTGTGEQQGKIQFKGCSLSTNQVIIFSVDNLSDTLISGSYVSYNPADTGTFSLRKTM